jgi:tetratricopeptide (TPR) repeat protein
VASEHAGTRAAERALIQVGGYLFTDKKYAEAQAIFNRIIQEYGDGEWVPQAFLGVATCMDALGKTNEAIEEFEKLRKRFSNHPVIDEAKLPLARLYEAQKPEEAYKLYDELVKSSPGNQMSGLSAEAGLRKEDLKEKHPELAKLDAPILPPQPMPTPGAPNITNRQVFTVTNRPTITTNPPAQITLTNRPGGATSQVIRLSPPATKPDAPAPPAPAPATPPNPKP